MRGRGPYHLEITPQMKARLIHVRQLLSEESFKLFRVSEPMRRSDEDFIAASTKTTMVTALLVRPTRTSKIEFRQFTKTASSDRIEAFLKESFRRHHSIRPIIFSRLLQFGEETLGWTQYVDATDKDQLVKHFGPDIIRPRR